MPEIELNPNRLVKIFYSTSLTRVPVVHAGSIRGHLIREKTIRQASNRIFFEGNLAMMFSQVVDFTEDHSPLFSEIDALKLSSIPVIDGRTFSLNECNLQDFNSIYRPVTQIEAAEAFTILESLSEPVVITNTCSAVVFKNKACKALHQEMLKTGAERKRVFEDYLDESFYAPCSLKGEERQLRIGMHVFKYRVRPVQLNRGLVQTSVFML